MEPICVRIKFTPLFQNHINGDSNCCLEIIPEVSFIENLDRLKWKKDTNFIEYTIPMTHKIILKRQKTSKDTNSDEEKIYHSCIDLLPLSKSSLDLASGDLSRIVSDTFIIRKISTNITRSTALNPTEASSIDANPKTNEIKVTNKTPDQSRNRAKLSLSPICSLSTRESQAKRYPTSRAGHCKVNDCQKNLVPLLKSIRSRENWSCENQPKLCSTEYQDSLLKSSCLPGIRISAFREYMQTEMLPIKIKLYEIFTKCTELGITFNKQSSNNHHANKPLSVFTNKITRKHIEPSNRAIYTVVFDG